MERSASTCSVTVMEPISAVMESRLGAFLRETTTRPWSVDT